MLKRKPLSLIILLGGLILSSFFTNPVLAAWTSKDYISLMGDEMANTLWGDFTKSWYYLQVKDLNNIYNGKLDLSSFKDLNFTQDWVFNANKKAIEAINEKKETLSKQVDTILEKISLKEQTIDSVENEYKKYIEIENDINEAEYVYVLALPINKFLLKENGNNSHSIVITREPKVWAWSVENLDTENVDQELKAVIDREINEIIEQPSIDLMKEKINQFAEKQGRNYSPLFIEKSFEQFFKDIDVSIAHKDRKFATTYSYRNKEYMNSFYYLPQKLKELEKHTDKYLFYYIPISSNNQAISSVFGGVDNKETTFRNSPELCFKIEYQDNHQLFNDHFCGLSHTFSWGTMKVKNIDIFYLNNYFIVLSRMSFMSVVYQLLILIACGIIPFFVVKYADKVIGFGSKFETEQL